MSQWRWLGIGIVVGFLFGASALVMASDGNQNVTVAYRNIKMVVNGEQIRTDAEPFIYNDRTYVPLRAVADGLKQPVRWDGNTYTVYIGTEPGDNTPATSQAGNPQDIALQAAKALVSNDRISRSALSAPGAVYVGLNGEESYVDADTGPGEGTITYSVTETKTVSATTAAVTVLVDQVMDKNWGKMWLDVTLTAQDNTWKVNRVEIVDISFEIGL